MDERRVEEAWNVKVAVVFQTAAKLGGLVEAVGGAAHEAEGVVGHIEFVAAGGERGGEGHGGKR
jgi:hypothetical protein